LKGGRREDRPRDQDILDRPEKRRKKSSHGTKVMISTTHGGNEKRFKISKASLKGKLETGPMSNGNFRKKARLGVKSQPCTAGRKNLLRKGRGPGKELAKRRRRGLRSRRRASNGELNRKFP